MLVVIAFGPDRLVPDKNGGLIEQRIARMSDLIGASATVAGVALAAVLIGGLLPGPRRLMNSLAVMSTDRYDALFDYILRNAEAVAGRLQWKDVLENPGAPRHLAAWAADAAEHATIQFTDQLEEPTEFKGQEPPEALSERYAASPTRVIPQDGEIDSFAVAAVPQQIILEMLSAGVDQEMPQLRVLLQIERETIWNEVDRLDAEADLRCAVAPPLTLIFATCAYLSGFLWLVGLVLVIALFVQGVLSRRDAQRKVRTALAHEVIRSATLQYIAGFRGSDLIELPHPLDPPSAPLNQGVFAGALQLWHQRQMRRKIPALGR